MKPLADMLFLKDENCIIALVYNTAISNQFLATAQDKYLYVVNNYMLLKHFR